MDELQDINKLVKTMKEAMAKVKSEFEGQVEDMKVKVDWLGPTMEEMKVEMRRMNRKVETTVKRGDNFVRYVSIAMD